MTNTYVVGLLQLRLQFRDNQGNAVAPVEKDSMGGWSSEPEYASAGSPKYTEFPEIAHGSWDAACASDGCGSGCFSNKRDRID